MSKENTDSKTTDGETKPVDTSVPNATSTNAELAEETVNKVAAAVTTSLTTSVASDSTDGTTKEPESSWFGGCCGLKSDKAVDGKKTKLAPGSKEAEAAEKLKAIQQYETKMKKMWKDEANKTTDEAAAKKSEDPTSKVVTGDDATTNVVTGGDATGDDATTNVVTEEDSKKE